MNKLVKDFMNFVREQGVVGVAVGIAVGLQAASLVSTLVDQFINPLVGILLQGTDLTGIKSNVEVGDSSVVFGWGMILQALITFLATAFVVYFIVEKTGLTKADKKK
ncbi:MAG TPA: MscL family protein [Candidatus Saccharibacteria bacterium]|jgi:large conductance mechanosensitive channel|nr:MscL family protein [Candidatus Saccharibacteria bacterium]HMT55591.1 MscL family protein [Candidatus Saccharibacteria bacterium]